MKKNIHYLRKPCIPACVFSKTICTNYIKILIGEAGSASKWYSLDCVSYVHMYIYDFPVLKYSCRKSIRRL